MKIKKINKKFLIGIVCGILASNTIPIVAKSAQHIIKEVKYNVIIKDTDFTPKNNIFTIDDVTYMSVDDLCDALNLTVSYGKENLEISEPIEKVYSVTNNSEAIDDIDIEKALADKNIPPDSDLAKELRLNPSAIANIRPLKRKSEVVESKTPESEIDGCVNISTMQKDDLKKYGKFSFSKSTKNINFVIDGKTYYIEFENVPKNRIGNIQITEKKDTVCSTTRGGYIDECVYIDKEFLESLK